MAKSTKSVWSSAKKQYTKSKNQWNKMTGFPTRKKRSFYQDYSITKMMNSKTYKPKKTKSTYPANFTNNKTVYKNNGCYIATCVYGSYDCPSVWTLRRFRDNVLKKTVMGRTFIRVYYAVSPKVVKTFGDTSLFKKICKFVLDSFVRYLNKKGFDDTEYFDE